MLRAPMPPETVYGKFFHCPTCGVSYTLVEAVADDDPWHVCAFCAQVIDLKAFLRFPPHKSKEWAK